MKVLEVNDNDIFGKIFNGYTIMEELNKKEEFDIKQLVISKFSKNPKCLRLFSNDYLINLDFNIHKLEHDIMSTHSLLSISVPTLKNNSYYKNSDLVHFHQVHNSRFDLPNFFELAKNKPTVISFHDPWFVTGRCVHPLSCEEWKKGCEKCNHLDTLFDLPEDNANELWKIKREIASTDVDIIVHSKFMYDMVKNNPYTKKLRVHEIPLALDINKYTYALSKEEAKQKLNISKNDTVIFFREQKELKGTNYIVEALKKIENKSNITLLTCSQKGLLKEIEDDFNIIELGTISEQQVRECYNASDLFLMPSIGESFGMMAIEAMASGVSTIVFDNSALPSTTGAPQYGILVKNLDSNDLYQKIDYYLKNPKEREERGKKSRKFVEKKYNYNKFFEQISKVYKEAYEKQKYKITLERKEKDISIDFNNQEVKKVIYRLNKVYDKLFSNEYKPDFLKQEYVEDDKKIEYSNSNVLNLINKFNNYIYVTHLRECDVKKMDLIYNNQEVLNENVGDPKISIIIPVYNGAKYVSLAIDSALRQTYKNIEIIVVNDGSKDDTDKICRSYGNLIKYIKKENGGVSTALNLGIKNMTGDYFSWLSHDDLYYPEKIQVEVDYLKKHKLLNTNTILYSNWSTIDSKGNLLDSVIFDSEDLNKNSAFALLKGAINGLTLLIPKKAFDEVGLFDTNLRCVQDYALWYDMYKYGYKFVHIQNILTVTRLHEESTTNTSPKLVSEGNDFWLKVAKDFNDSKKKELYQSVYNYYFSLFNFFNGGPYDKLINYFEIKYKEIEQKNINHNKKVSVVLVLEKNVSSCVRAINSVLNQTYKNIELIIVNNGYNENIEEINKIVKKNKKIIKYIFNKNSDNKSKAFNLGIKNSTGDYIAFLEENCIFEKEKIEKQVLKMVCSKTPISHTSYYSNIDNSVEFVNSGYLNGYMKSLILKDFCISISTVMVDKNYLIKNDKLFDEKIDVASDICFILSVMNDSILIGIKEPLSIIFNESNEKKYELKLYTILSLIIKRGETIDGKGHLLEILKKYLNELGINNQEYIYNQIHADELSRYQYLQTKESHIVSKTRKITNKITFRKNIPTYQLDNNALFNSKINRMYRKARNIRNKIKK